MTRYYFGLYHWRRRFRRILVGVLAGVLGAALAHGSRRRRTGGTALAGWGLYRAATGLRSLLVPLPWRVERYKYEALADALPLEEAHSLLDAGCGTGRSLVGLAEAVPEGCRVAGVDVFDDSIILGNGPRLAERNGERAGLDVAAVRGDATALPVADSSQDVVTACRLLHDLAADEARAALGEFGRVCSQDGAVGVLELPVTHERATTPPERYWPKLVESAGFAVDRVERVPRRRTDDAYVVVVAEPE